jgi:hypothetical protein
MHIGATYANNCFNARWTDVGGSSADGMPDSDWNVSVSAVRDCSLHRLCRESGFEMRGFVLRLLASFSHMYLRPGTHTETILKSDNGNILGR